MSDSDRGDTLDELVQFLTSARTDLRATALDYVLNLSGTPEGRSLIGCKAAAVGALVGLVGDAIPTIVRNTVCCLVNLSGEERYAAVILDELISRDLMQMLLNNVVKPDCEPAEPIAMLFTNLSRLEKGVTTFVKLMTADHAQVTMGNVVQALCVKGYNKGTQLDHLAPFLGNLTLSESARAYFLNKDRSLIRRLLPFTFGSYSAVRRRGVVVILKNCCFEAEHHAWLLSDEVGILTALLLPLAGPEELPDDEMEVLPPDLQYLEPTKEREPQADIRKMLVEALNQLCATKLGRTVMRKHNVYVIIREYHKWEPVKMNEPAIYNLIDVLIGDEPKEEHANLRTVEIPPEVQSLLGCDAAPEGLLNEKEPQQ